MADVDQLNDLTYWRNDLFARILIYLLPLCLIALIPGLYWSFVTHLYLLILVDILVVSAFLIIAFVPGIQQGVRKATFVCCLYLLSYTLLYYLGISGPGLLYMLVGTIFTILIFPARYAFWPAWLNIIICTLFVPFISFNFISWPVAGHHLVGEWIAVASNLIFLSFLVAALIPRLFNGMQQSIDKEKQLQAALKIQEQSLREALNLLHKKNKELEQFAYVASHDLNEPLRMVTAFMGLLKNKYGAQLDQKALTYMNFALDGGKRMQKMIADLLVLSRTSRHEEVKEWLRPDEILTEVTHNIYKLIDDNRATIVLDAAPELLNIYRADITRLLQNLFSNAIKFRKVDVLPVIRLCVEEQETQWLFRVEDNGIGVEAGKSEKIFEIFTRLHSPEEYEGTGIGLAICKKIVEYNGGRIWVESEKGEGSIFIFSINK